MLALGISEAQRRRMSHLRYAGVVRSSPPLEGRFPKVVADGETGRIVPVEDYPERAARAIERLDEIDPTACRERVEKLFSRESMLDGYERVFDRVLSEEAGRS